MHEWQKDLWAVVAGSDPREMKIYMGGRNVGKSVMSQMWNQMFTELVQCEIIDKSIVDNKQFYTVKCSKDIADWLRNQPGENEQWYQHIDHNWIMDRTMFDIDEDLYLILKLRWGC
jgi:hypothetical protein